MGTHKHHGDLPPSVGRARHVVPLSCPDCFGVLRVEPQGRQGHVVYRCQVDHRYSLPSLLEATEIHLERSLWSAALLLTQVGIAYEDLLAQKTASRETRKQAQRRIREVRKQCLAIRAMIEAPHVIE